MSAARVHRPDYPTLSDAITRAVEDAQINQKQLADDLVWKPAKVTELKLGRQEAGVCDLLALGNYACFPMEGILDVGTRGDLLGTRGVCWRPAGRSLDVKTQEMRLAGNGVLEGQSVEAIASRIETLYCGHKLRPPALDERRIRAKAQGALRFGCVELVLSESGEEIEDRATAAELARALERRSPCGREPEVHVVRNLCDPSFSYDPMSPFFVALRAHRLVAGKMRGRSVARIGLAGGIHCESFARMTGPGGSPFPPGDDLREVTFVPLTLEPFTDHRLPLASAVVGDLAVRARDLLDPEGIDGRTIQPFGYLVGGQYREDNSDAIVLARDHYRKLHVAIFGIGDAVQDGWLSEVLRHVHVEAPEEPVTDVCLNLLSETGTPIPLPDGRQFVGVGLRDIERLVQQPDRMALLLTSGKAKGLPLTIVTGAGYADTIVCDQAAARAALKELAGV